MVKQLFCGIVRNCRRVGRECKGFSFLGSARMQHIIINIMVQYFFLKEKWNKTWKKWRERPAILELLSLVFLDEALQLSSSCKKVIIYLDGP